MSVSDELEALRLAVVGVGPGSSLAEKVRAAQFDLALGDRQDACAVLRAFIREVKAQARKSIPGDTAASLVNDANRIRELLGC